MLGCHYTICKDYILVVSLTAGPAGALPAVAPGPARLADPFAVGSLLACSAVLALLAASLHLCTIRGDYLFWLVRS